jgi:hypothetical protein
LKYPKVENNRYLDKPTVPQVTDQRKLLAKAVKSIQFQTPPVLLSIFHYWRSPLTSLPKMMLSIQPITSAKGLKLLLLQPKSSSVPSRESVSPLLLLTARSRSYFKYRVLAKNRAKSVPCITNHITCNLLPFFYCSTNPTYYCTCCCTYHLTCFFKLRLSIATCHNSYSGIC